MRQSPSQDTETCREGKRDSRRDEREQELSAAVSDELVLGTRDPSVVSDPGIPGAIRSSGYQPGVWGLVFWGLSNFLGQSNFV